MALVTAFAALLALGLPPQDAVQVPPAQQPPATTLDEVVVENRTLRETVDSFVESVIAAPVGRSPARWDRKVCVGVANLRREAAQVIVDRVSAIAIGAGLEAGEPGCSPNILVVASADGDVMARAMVEASPNAFRPQYAGAARSARQLELFQSAGTPVRWWHVSIPVTQDGQIAVRLPGEGSPPIIPQEASRLRTNVQNDLLRAFIVVDVTKASNVTAQQLGDYVGMVAMTQIDPDAETGAYDTVLNLFAPGHQVAGLTDWDASYLKSLYDAELNRKLVNQQTGEVGQLMLRDRQAADPSE